jgi:hypothetical protein
MTLYAILGTIVLAILGAFGLVRKSARAERDRLRADQAEDTLRRTDAGREAADDADNALGTGMTPQDLKRLNDKKWGKK